MFIIDRFEGKWAVIEFGKETFNLPKKLLPPETKEGDVLDIKISINREETQKKKEKIKKLAKELFD